MSRNPLPKSSGFKARQRQARDNHQHQNAATDVPGLSPSGSLTPDSSPENQTHSGVFIGPAPESIGLGLEDVSVQKSQEIASSSTHQDARGGEGEDARGVHGGSSANPVSATQAVAADQHQAAVEDESDAESVDLTKTLARCPAKYKQLLDEPRAAFHPVKSNVISAKWTLPKKQDDEAWGDLYDPPLYDD